MAEWIFTPITPNIGDTYLMAITSPPKYKVLSAELRADKDTSAPILYFDYTEDDDAPGSIAIWDTCVVREHVALRTWDMVAVVKNDIPVKAVKGTRRQTVQIANGGGGDVTSSPKAGKVKGHLIAIVQLQRKPKLNVPPRWVVKRKPR